MSFTHLRTRWLLTFAVAFLIALSLRPPMLASMQAAPQITAREATLKQNLLLPATDPNLPTTNPNWILPYIRIGK